MQSRLSSAMEVASDVAIGFAISLSLQVVLMRAYGVPTSLSTDVGITGWFTVAGLVRRYVVRRLFNRWGR